MPPLSLRWAKFLYLALGLGLFAYLLSVFDVAEALALAATVGLGGVASLCAVYLVVFTFDVLLWQICLTEVPFAAHWTLRLFRVRLVGEAYNDTMPMAGLGGEPVKAALLRANYGIALTASSVSIILFRVVNLYGQILLLALAFVFMAAMPRVVAEIGAAALAGFLLLLFMAVSVAVLPAWRLTSRFGKGLSSWGPTAGIGRLLALVEGAESQVAGFYRGHRGRFFAALTVSLLQWLAGAVEMWLAMRLLGQPITLAEAVVIEALVQAVRTASFFVPSNLGTQDGTIVILSTLFTGSPVAGLSAALLRRLRQVIWIVTGFAVGGHYSWRAFRAYLRENQNWK